MRIEPCLSCGMSPQDDSESLNSFKTSFSYGTRNDLDFKFFKSLSDDDVAEFLQNLLRELGDAYDTGDILPLIHGAIEAQAAGYSPDPNVPPRYEYQDGPWSDVGKPVAQSRVGMLTTSGHFVVGDDPQPFGESAMTQEEAVDRISEFMRHAPTLSEIPSSTPTADLRVRHGGYDIRSATRDANATFPIDRLRTAADEGRVGELASAFFSFPGATSQGRLRKLLPEWVARIQEEDVDFMLLVPV
jgi:hypothetical protein